MDYILEIRSSLFRPVGDMSVIKFLVKLEANVNAVTNSSGYYPIIGADHERHDNVVKFLLLQGADLLISMNVITFLSCCRSAQQLSSSNHDQTTRARRPWKF